MDNITISLLIILSISITSSVIKDISYQKERKDLLNRIMAKDLSEYNNIGNNSLPKGNNSLKKSLEKRSLENKDFEGFYE